MGTLGAFAPAGERTGETWPAVPWAADPDLGGLDPDEAHVWSVDLDELGDFEGLLSEEEHWRAGRFRRPDDRRRWVAGRGLLRTMLGWYLHADPARVRLERAAHGKPALAGHASLHFNLSRSRSRCLLAFAASGEVGVDVEEVRTDIDLDEVARYLDLRAPPGGPDDFYRRWTTLEAVLKALGTGLTGSPAAELPDGWTLLALDPAPGCVGAVVVASPRPRLRCRHLEGP